MSDTPMTSTGREINLEMIVSPSEVMHCCMLQLDYSAHDRENNIYVTSKGQQVKAVWDYNQRGIYVCAIAPFIQIDSPKSLNVRNDWRSETNAINNPEEPKRNRKYKSKEKPISKSEYMKRFHDLEKQVEKIQKAYKKENRVLTGEERSVMNQLAAFKRFVNHGKFPDYVYPDDSPVVSRPGSRHAVSPNKND